MNYARWNVFWADFNPVIGSEQAGYRSVLVISESENNDILPVVNILPITTRKNHRQVYPNEYLLPVGEGGLAKESIVLCYQIRTLDKRRLVKQLSAVTDIATQNGIEEALAFQLNLPLQ